MKLVVLDSGTLGEDLDLAPLYTFGEVCVYPATAPADVTAHLAGAQVAVVNKVHLGAENLAGATELRLICIAATGVDNVDVAYCRKAGIAVCNVLGYSTHSVSQVTLAMALSLTCHLPEYTDRVRSGEYSRSGAANCLTPRYRELYGRTWGVLGYGNIGRQVAKVAAAMGCRVLFCKRTPVPEEGCVDLDTLLTQSDVLSVHTPLTAETRGLIGANALARMKKDAILINVARGAVLDEAAVAAAVLEGRLGGFGCDVYATEPFPPDHPYAAIAAMPNVCLTPHMAWGAVDARHRCLAEMVENIRAFLAGERRCRVDL